MASETTSDSIIDILGDNINSEVITILDDNKPLSSRQDAIAFLNHFTRHKIGQLVEVLYNTDDTNKPIDSVVAIGVKNYDDCNNDQPSSGDVDRGSIKYYNSEDYPNGPCGSEFYVIIYPCGGSSDLYHTTIKVNGKDFIVLNNNGRNEQTTDPFEWEDMKDDIVTQESGTNNPIKGNNTEINVNKTKVYVASDTNETTSDIMSCQEDNIFGEFSI